MVHPRDEIPDRIGFFRNGWLLDEIVAAESRLDFQRVAPSRFEVRLATSLVALDLDLWTTPRGEVDFWTDGDAPAWVPTVSKDGRIASITSDTIGVHFEHLDRNFYFLGLFLPADHWAMHFFGAGYLKLAPKRRAHPRALTLHLSAPLSPEELRVPLANAVRVVPDRLAFCSIGAPPLGLAQRAIPVETVDQAGDFPVAITLDSLEQGLPTAARLARTLGLPIALRKTPTQTHAAIVTPKGDIVRGPEIA